MPRRKFKSLDLSRDLSDSAKKKIEAARARAVSNLLESLRMYWEQYAGSAAALRSRDPFEVVRLFDSYAEAQFDAYAEELLNQVPDVYKYGIHLATDVTDAISTAILPNSYIRVGVPLMDQWTDLCVQWEKLEPATRELLSGPAPEPIGDWEVYLARSFSMRMLQGKLKSHNAPNRAAAIAMFNRLFVVKYQLYLRPFMNGQRFDGRLRAHLSNRLEHWRAVSRERRAVGSLLARNIKRLMRECGWSFDTLAERTRIAKTSILDHVNKGVVPHADTLNLYAQVFSKRLGREITVADLEAETE